MKIQKNTQTPLKKTKKLKMSKNNSKKFLKAENQKKKQKKKI